MKNFPAEGSNHFQAENQLLKYEVHSRLRPNVERSPHPNFDFGALNQYKLEDLINVQSDGFKEGAVVRIAFLENHSLHLEEEAVQLLEQYAKYEIAFAAIFGSKGSGKSLLLDKLLNLSESEGSHFTKTRQATKGIYMWSIAFSRGNTKVFLLDIDGCQADSEDYQLLLSFYLFLASTVLLLAAPQDLSFQQLTGLTKHLKNARKPFSAKEEIYVDSVWPAHLYCLFRAPVPQSKALRSVRKMFMRFSWRVVGNALDEKQGQVGENPNDVQLRKYAARKKILNEGYLRGISAVIRSLHAQIECKSLGNLRFTGANLVKLAVNAVQSLNVKGELSLDRISRRSLKELYQEAYEYHTQLYNEQLAGFLADERPFELDYLISAFKDSHEAVFKSFAMLTTSPQLAQTYSQKLERYVAQKERIVLAINKKKCASEAKLAVPNAKPPLQVTQFIQQAKKSPKCLQQVYAAEIMPIMAKAIQQVEIQRRKDGGKVKDSQPIEVKLRQRESLLQQLKKENVKKSSVVKERSLKKELLDGKEKKLNEVIKKLRTQLNQVKSSAKAPDNPVEPLKSSQQLRAEEERLRKEMKMKQRTLVQLKSQRELPVSLEQIELLNSQIEQKVMKQRELMESAMASHIPKLQSIQTFRSNSKIATPRKVQSRVFRSESPQMRIISSPKV